MTEALIISRTGRTTHVHLHQEITGGWWATTSKSNSNTGWSLYNDGSVVKERYNAQTNERIRSEHVAGATWKTLDTAQ